MQDLPHLVCLWIQPYNNNNKNKNKNYYLLFVFASLCSSASLWGWGVATKTARRIKSSFPSKEKQRTTWQWWTAGEKIFLNDLYNIPIRVKQLMLWVLTNPEPLASLKSWHVPSNHDKLIYCIVHLYIEKLFSCITNVLSKIPSPQNKTCANSLGES